MDETTISDSRLNKEDVMSANLNVVHSTPKHILLVIANSATSTTVGGPVGFWAAELTHAYYEFVERGYEVTIASPRGGKCELDAFSDPRHESGYSAFHDSLLSLNPVGQPKRRLNCYNP